MAPEAVFPAAAEDCYATVRWLVEHGAEEMNVDPSKLAIGGDSAGGNLSAAVSLMVKDRLEVPADTIKSQILIYPSLAPPIDENCFESYRLFGVRGEYALNFYDVKRCNDLYSGNPQAVKDNKYRFPLVASHEELCGVAPCLMIVCEADSLRDEGEAYAAKLLEAGVATTSIRVNATSKSFHSSLKQYDSYLSTCYDSTWLYATSYRNTTLSTKSSNDYIPVESGIWTSIVIKVKSGSCTMTCVGERIAITDYETK